MKYLVQQVETYEVIVEAESEEEAIEKVGDSILAPENYAFSNITAFRTTTD